MSSALCFFTPELRLTEQEEDRRALDRLAQAIECSSWRDTCHFCSQVLARLASRPSIRCVRKDIKNNPIMCLKAREAGRSGVLGGHGVCNHPGRRR